jgi:hypothetical protein
VVEAVDIGVIPILWGRVGGGSVRAQPLPRALLSKTQPSPPGPRVSDCVLVHCRFRREASFMCGHGSLSCYQTPIALKACAACQA